MPTISLVRQHKVNGETLTFTDTVACNGLITADITAAPGVAKLAQPIAATASLLQSVFIASTQPVTLYANGTNAAQTLTISGGPTGGTFTLSGTAPAAWTTAAIAYNATAAQVASAVQAAIVAVSGGSGTTVSGSGGPLPGSAVVLTFGGTLGLQPVATMTVTTTSLTGGTPSGSVASTTTGVNPTQTWTLPAGVAIDWASQDGFFANPITANLVQLSVSNPNTVAASVVVRLGTN